jgi:hypothetical protein
MPQNDSTRIWLNVGELARNVQRVRLRPDLGHKGRLHLPLVQLLPVDWGEEEMVANFLRKKHSVGFPHSMFEPKLHLKVGFGPKTLQPILLQHCSQQIPRLGRCGARNAEWLVQRLLVHLVLVLACKLAVDLCLILCRSH